MKKNWISVLSVMVAISLMASTAWAAPGENKGQGKKSETQAEQQSGVEAEAEAEAEVEGTTEEDNSEEESVTDSVYGDKGNKGKKGYKGLQKAFENVKNTPAGARIAQLLESKYDIEVEVSEELSLLADELEVEGDLDAAASVQEEAVKADYKNIGMYKKLGKLYDKMERKGVKAFVNGNQPKFDVPPMIKEGRVLVPFRAISEALNAEVTWNADEKSVTVTRGETVVVLFLGSNTALINDVEVSLDVPGQVENGRTIVPMRFLIEAFKAEVIWDQETKSVIVIDDEIVDEEEAITAESTTETTVEATTEEESTEE